MSSGKNYSQGHRKQRTQEANNVKKNRINFIVNSGLDSVG